MYKNYTQFNVKYRNKIWNYPKIHEFGNLKYRCFYRILIQTLSKYKILGEWLEGFINFYKPLDYETDLIRLFLLFFKKRENSFFTIAPFSLQTPIYLENVPGLKTSVQTNSTTSNNSFTETYLNWANLAISTKDRFLHEVSKRYENSIKALILPKKNITTNPASIFSDYRETLDEKYLLNDDLIDLDIKIKKREKDFKVEKTLKKLKDFIDDWETNHNLTFNNVYTTSTSFFDGMINYL